MDIRKLQRAIVDGLEDVKAQNIVVFNTEALSPLFERVIIATGASNRQTKALASSVRDAVKGRGMQVMRTEGADNGEWIIVDCGAAVVHIMQPAMREYYNLEEIWGGKPVSLKLGSAGPARLPKAESAAAEPAAGQFRPKPTGAPVLGGERGAPAAAKKAPAKKAPAKKAAAKKAPAKRPAAKQVPARQAEAGSTPARKRVAAKRAAPAKSAAPAKKVVVGKPTSKPAKPATAARGAGVKAAVGKAPARKPAGKTPAGTATRTAARKAPAAKRAR
jgi:ribosome-associated protein